MNHDSWATVSRLLDEALDLSPADRPRWLDRLAPQYSGVLPRLRSLLAAPAPALSAAFLDTIPKVDETGQPRLDDAEDDEPAPVSVGPYQVLRKLAEGGMGSVWLGERSDGMVKRPVALKLPRGAWFREALVLLEEADRFWRGFDAGNRWAGEAAFWLGRCLASMRRDSDARSSLTHAADILSRSPLQTDMALVRIARQD